MIQLVRTAKEFRVITRSDFHQLSIIYLLLPHDLILLVDLILSLAPEIGKASAFLPPFKIKISLLAYLNVLSGLTLKYPQR